MKWSTWKKRVLAATALVVFSGTFAWAQTGSTDESKRKVKSKTDPVYPDLAQRMKVVGKVKIEIVVTPNGRVKSTRVLGGHPLLVKPCQDAVKQWKFFPASEETIQIVEFEFHKNK